jgi:hypothetical protein
MTESKKKDMPEVKSIRHIVEEKIAAALIEFKEQVGEKRFDEKVEKAAKIIAKSIIKHPSSEVEAPVKKIEKAEKKAVKKPPTPAKKAAVKKAPAKKAQGKRANRL